jgi:acyl carrier protein
MYRTGDIARYLPDGNLEFLGRRDSQIKMRGIRIELGEIESALAEQPDVAANVVTASECGLGESRLVAYVVAKGERRPSARELRQHLRTILPDHMVPAAFVLLDQFPLTPSGKVDRKQLPAPGDEHFLAHDAGHVAPRNAIEEQVAVLFADVLGLGRVGVNDNFFELGGHSLLAVQLINRIRHDLDIDLSVRQLFETPTVSGLALVASSNPATDATDRPIQSGERRQHNTRSFDTK